MLPMLKLLQNSYLYLHIHSDIITTIYLLFLYFLCFIFLCFYISMFLCFMFLYFICLVVYSYVFLTEGINKREQILHHKRVISSKLHLIYSPWSVLKSQMYSQLLVAGSYKMLKCPQRQMGKYYCSLHLSGR